MLVLETNDFGRGGSNPSTRKRMTERLKVSDLKSEVALKNYREFESHSGVIDLVKIYVLSPELKKMFCLYFA